LPLTPDTQAAVELLFDYAATLGLTPRVTSTVRSCAEQNALYAKGRTTEGPVVTNARGCISWHVLERAVDVSLGAGAPIADYEVLGEFWESLGGFWGGRIPGLGDFGHFEWHPGVSIEELCSNPGDCSGAVARSRELFLAPAGKDPLLVAVGVAALVFAAWYFSVEVRNPSQY
jgi:hypothetical protein